MIKALSIQVQPERAAEMRIDAVLGAFEEIARLPLVEWHEFSDGQDEGSFYNFTFGTADIPRLWREVQQRVFADSELGLPMSVTSMAMCEGTRGWDDYLLLYHFDPNIPLDEMA
jgi:hypothetical protein